MPKKGSGKAKNSVNKAKHTRLMQQKANKLREQKLQNKERLKALIKKVNETKNKEKE